MKISRKPVKSVYRGTLAALGLLIASISPSYAQLYSESDRIVKSFLLHPSSSVELNNKYGKVHLINWDYDSIRIEIDLNIQSTSPARLKKIRSNIDFEFIETGYYITAETIFRSRYYDFFDEIKNLTETIFPSDNQVLINYTVYLPEKVSIRVNNKYGDLYAGDLDGDLKISLSNGKLKANRLSGRITLDLNQSEAVVNYLGNATCSMNFAEIEVKECKKASVSSLSSRITMENVEELRLDSRRDRVYLTRVGRLYGESYFSDFWIRNLLNETDLKIKYGDFNVDHIDKHFARLVMTTEYADINLFLEKGTSFRTDIESRDTYIYLPDKLNVAEEKVLDQEKNYRILSGFLGESSPAARISLNSHKGSIRLSVR